MGTVMDIIQSGNRIASNVKQVNNYVIYFYLVRQ